VIQDRYGYRGTLRLLAEWKQHHVDFVKTEPKPGKEEEWQGQKTSIETEIYLIEEELEEFRDLANGKSDLPSLDPFKGIGRALIKWRVGRGWSLEELASKADVDFILVVSYQHHEYEIAPLSDVMKIRWVLRGQLPESPINEYEEALKDPDKSDSA